MKYLSTIVISFVTIITSFSQSPMASVNGSTALLTDTLHALEDAVISLEVYPNTEGWEWTGPEGYMGSGAGIWLSDFNLEKQGAYVATSTVNPNQPDVIFELIYLEDDFADNDIVYHTCGTEQVVIQSGYDGLLYNWSTSESTPTIVVDGISTSSYSVTVSTIFGDSDEAIITVNNSPRPDVNYNITDAISCAQEGILSLQLSSNQGLQFPLLASIYRDNVLFQETSLSNMSSTIELPAGNYTSLDLTSSEGCVFSYNGFLINTYTGTSEEFDMATRIICQGDELVIDALGGYASYLWDNGDQSPAILVSPMNTTTYSVEMYDENGCGISVNYPIIVKENAMANMTYVNDPNADGGLLTLQLNSYNQDMFPINVYGIENGNEVLISAMISQSSLVLTSSNYYDNVRLITKHGCVTDLGIMDSNTSIDVTLMDTTFVCAGGNHSIVGPANYEAYLWNNGSDSLEYNDIALESDNALLIVIDSLGIITEFVYPVVVQQSTQADYSINSRVSNVLGSIDIEILNSDLTDYPMDVYITDIVSGEESYLTTMTNSSANVQLSDGSFSDLKIINAHGCTTNLGNFEMGLAQNITGNRIAGKVWLDVYSNTGVMSDEESGLEGVIVRAINIEGDIKAQTVSDPDGSYTLDLDSEAVYLEFDPIYNFTETVANMGNGSEVDSDVDGSNGPGTTDLLVPVDNKSVNAGFIYSVLSLSWNDIFITTTERSHDINWNVNGQENTSHYEVELSLNNINNFSHVSTVSRIDSEDQSIAYNFSNTDMSEAGTYYYRIKEVEYDGRSTYSKIVSANSDQNIELNSSIEVNVYPIPATDNLTINLSNVETTEEILAYIYTADGKLVYSQSQGHIGSGAINATVDMDVSQLDPNVYILHLTIGNKLILRKVIIK